MKKILFSLVASVGIAFGAFANNWTYTITSGEVAKGTSGILTDGVWTFNASVDKNTTNMTVKEPVDAECPMEVKPLDFSGKIVDSADDTIEYTIIKLDTKFNNHSDINDFVGELTLPGEGFTTLLANAFNGCSEMTGDLKFPTTMISVGCNAVQNTKITSVYFAPTTSRCTLSGGYGGNGSFSHNYELTNVVFAAGGKMATYCSGAFYNSSKLVKADLSGAIDLDTYPGRETSDNYSQFSNCSKLEEIIIGAGVTNLDACSLFGNNGTSLKTVRFLGPPPESFANTSTSFPYLFGIATSQKVTTIVPLDYIEEWRAYAAGGVLNTHSSTWATECVKSGTALSNRLLILDRSAGDDAPTITSVARQAYGNSTNDVTVIVEGVDLLGGKVSVDILLDDTVVATLADQPDYGTYTIDGLEPDTTYIAQVVASNANGAVTNSTLSFKTFAVASSASATAFYDPVAKTTGFYNDTIDRSGISGCIVYSVSGAATWTKDSAFKSTKKVVFDPSFASVRPTSCSSWFEGFSSLIELAGIEYLDVSSCSSLSYMFKGTALTSLDLSRFKTANVTILREMFRGSQLLKTIYANENFSLLSVTDGYSMFFSCSVICGGAGTTYDANHVDSVYARVDDPDHSAPGYFTFKAPPGVAPTISSVAVYAISNTTASVSIRGSDLQGGTVTIELYQDSVVAKSAVSSSFGDFVFNDLTRGTEYSVKVTAVNTTGTTIDDSVVFSTWGTTTLAPRAVYTTWNSTLVFYYDDVDRSSGATVYEFNKQCSQTWGAVNLTCQYIIFDKSFKNFRPTSCSSWFAYFRGVSDSGMYYIGMENLDTREVTSMYRMFYNAKFKAPPDTTHFNTKKVTTFNSFTTYGGWAVMDCSSFDTRSATDMQSMFCGCTTIYANEHFVTDKVGASQAIFDSTRIVGGAGTEFNKDHKTKEYARIDGGPDSDTPGYFTYKRYPAPGLKIILR